MIKEIRKIALPFLCFLATSTVVCSTALADDQMMAEMPKDSTKNKIIRASDGIPSKYATPEILKIISDFESGKITIDTAPHDSSVKGVWETWDDNGSVKEVSTGKVTKQGEYAWKFLSDKKDGVPMGVSVRFGPYDNAPHYHKQGEAFYVIEGECLLNVNGKLVPFKKGDFVFLREMRLSPSPILRPVLS